MHATFLLTFLLPLRGALAATVTCVEATKGSYNPLAGGAERVCGKKNAIGNDPSWCGGEFGTGVWFNMNNHVLTLRSDEFIPAKVIEVRSKPYKDPNTGKDVRTEIDFWIKGGDDCHYQMDPSVFSALEGWRAVGGED